ncbi:MAG TPA: hypothetical protein VGL56_00880 [Fimbriimonadaceae bacterium]|jgi:hypothetical protein
MITHRLQNKQVSVDIHPEVGGRISSFVHLRSGYDYVWCNTGIPNRREEPGTEYDPNFFGGLEELLPNDLEENIDGVDCPDHGELWTLELETLEATDRLVKLEGELPLFRLRVEKSITLEHNACVVYSRITNMSNEKRHFLWKLHAALKIEPGDRIDCEAARYTAVDPEWSRRKGFGHWEGEEIPAFDGTTEFLYLQGLRSGTMSWSNRERKFEIQFDTEVFPYAWYFASYGGFFDHHVAILEPCTTMPKSVVEAAKMHQCSALGPNDSLETTYRYVAS